MRITLACHPNSFGRFGPEAALSLLPEAGIPCLELPIKTAGVASPFGETPLLTNASSEAELQRVKDRVSQAGLALCSCNITSGNPLNHDVLEITLHKLKMARGLGIELVVAGGGEFQGPNEEQQLVSHLRRIAQVAHDLGLTYCCETHPGAFQNARSMLRMLEQVDHPSIGINFDTANILYYNEDPDLWSELQQVLPSVRHIHLKDSKGKYQEWHFPALGDGGAVDFVRLKGVLSEARFHGPCSLEIEGLPGESDLPLDQYKQRLTKSVQHLKACGYTW